MLTPPSSMGSDIQTFRNLLRETGTVLLDGGDADASWLFTHPVDILQPGTPVELDETLVAIDEATHAGRYAAGFLTYEAGEAMLFGRSRSVSQPLAWIAIFEQPPRRLAVDAFASVEGPAVAAGIDGLPDRQTYDRSFARVHHHIREGDVYQINLTGRGIFRAAGDPIDLYLRLRRRQPVAYGAFINAGDRLMLSYSPELFFERRGRRITTRPMKGTAPRHRSERKDEEARRFLQTDPKNRAENLMIVDLLRNDLSMICEAGSVRTRRMFSIEKLPTVWQMTSQVDGILSDGVDYRGIFRALFPSGSITGAPKRRAMEIIRTVEPEPRGVYCGAIGYAGPGDNAVFNVAIRTIEIRNDRGTIGTGSGVVWDSTSSAEFEEMHLKTRFLSAVSHDDLEAEFHLIETMRAVNGSVPLLRYHLDRLLRSARYFDIPVTLSAIESMVDDAASSTSEISVIRLTIGVDGRCNLGTRRVRDWPNRPLRIGFAPFTVSSTDPFVYHKTSRREPYDAALEWARENALDEALLLNERGEVADGSRSSIIVRKGTEWVAPLLTSGVLPSVFRASFIDRRSLVERVLHPADVFEADEIIIGNAVRGAARCVIRAAAEMY